MLKNEMLPLGFEPPIHDGLWVKHSTTDLFDFLMIGHKMN